MSNRLEIFPQQNKVELQVTNNQLQITDVTRNTDVQVLQPTTAVVQVQTGIPGPQGPPGDPSNLTGSFVNIDTYNNFTSSYNTGSFTGSFTGNLTGTSSYATNALTASYLEGYISPFPFTGSAIITGSLEVTGSITATQGISGSFSGSGANLFDIPSSGIVGLNLSQIISGSVSASISPDTGLQVNTDVTATSFTGSLFGTSSWAQNSISSSYALNSTSASYALTASYVTPLYQNVLLSGSLKFDPTQDPDPSGLDLDSTVLFQSSSNTALGYDLYVRQNGNLVKWKWVEGILETGLLYGGVVSYSGSNVIVSPGSGIIVDHNATTGSEVGPIVTYVTWNAITQSISNIATQQVTYLYIDNNGDLQQQSSRFTSQQYHEYIPLGAVGHFDYTQISAFGGQVQTAYDQISQISNFVDAFGPLKISGYGITGQAGSLRLSVGSGISFIHGGFYENDPEYPSQITTPAQPTASFAYVYRSGSGVQFDTNGGNFYTSLRPGFYDNGTGITGSVSNNDWTIQRVFSDPKTGVLYIYYGQTIYPDYLTAVGGLATDPFTEGDTFDFTTFIGFVVVKSNTSNITDTDNKIVPAGLFRGSGQGSGGGVALSNLDDLTDVTIISPSDGQALIYDAGLWKNGTPISASYAQTASFAQSGNGPFSGSFSGSGANLFDIPASGITGLNLSQIATGSVTASVSPGTGSFQITSGSTSLLFVSSSGNIGIGKTSPNAKLDVSGSVTITGSLTSTATTLLNTLSGNTSIGLPTNTATARLQVRGTGATSSTTALRVQNSSLTDLLTVRDDGQVTIPVTPSAGTTTDKVLARGSDGFIRQVGSLINNEVVTISQESFGLPVIDSLSIGTYRYDTLYDGSTTYIVVYNNGTPLGLNTIQTDTPPSNLVFDPNFGSPRLRFVATYLGTTYAFSFNPTAINFDSVNALTFSLGSSYKVSLVGQGAIGIYYGAGETNYATYDYITSTEQIYGNINASSEIAAISQDPSYNSSYAYVLFQNGTLAGYENNSTLIFSTDLSTYGTITDSIAVFDGSLFTDSITRVVVNCEPTTAGANRGLIVDAGSGNLLLSFPMLPSTFIRNFENNGTLYSLSNEFLEIIGIVNLVNGGINQSYSEVFTHTYLTPSMLAFNSGILYIFDSNYYYNRTSLTYYKQGLVTAEELEVERQGLQFQINNISQIATGSVTASVSPTQFTVTSGGITELIVEGTGVTLGSTSTDVHTVTGSLNVTGSTTLRGNATITGSLEVSGSIRITDDLIVEGNIIKDIKIIPDTTYTLLNTDRNKILHFTSATDVTITIPTGLSSTNRYEGKQLGTGQLIFGTDMGVTLYVGASELAKTAEQYSVFGLDVVGAEEYLLFGKLELV
jgi:hypothetical protein